MKLEYVGPAEPASGWPRWAWRTWNPHERQWWTFLFGLRDHQQCAIAAIWRATAPRAKRGRK